METPIIAYPITAYPISAHPVEPRAPEGPTELFLLDSTLLTDNTEMSKYE